MGLPNEILKQYWGYDSFRPLQSEIINSVLNHKDTLALLPTGGGKSICYQIPAIIKDGFCLVVSPLIALMKDQVENLKKKGISAAAITSGMTYREIDITIENACNGKYKFLYLSPERIKTEIFQARIRRMNISFIAIDEAHCISQWGYDFRPAYLEIGLLREILPETRFLALTATATNRVIDDIQDKLSFSSKNIFKASFARPNLAYLTLEEENKYDRLLKIISKVNGSGIIYLNSRKGTRETAEYLYKNGIQADYYHAGLTHKQRDEKQNAWKDGKLRIICATNAFGMGIDKSDVRFVIHLTLPDSIENYFQEAGRAGRDEKKAFAVILYRKQEIEELFHRIELNFPDINFIRRVYLALGNYYQLAIGGGLGSSYPFDIGDFSNKYNLPVRKVLNSIKFLEKEGYVTLEDVAHLPSRFKVTIPHQELYQFKVANKAYSAFIDLLLRSYTGYFEEYVSIRESDLARKINTSRFKIVKALEYLHHLKAIDYIPQSEIPKITYLTERLNDKTLPISKHLHEELKLQSTQRAKAIGNYLLDQSTCRSQFLMKYFGELDSPICNVCNICIDQKNELTDSRRITIQNSIKTQLLREPLEIKALIENQASIERKHYIEVIEFMLSEQLVMINDNGQLELANN